MSSNLILSTKLSAMKNKEKQDFIKSILNVATKCECSCHYEDNVMHMFPCCDKTYQKYE